MSAVHLEESHEWTLGRQVPTSVELVGTLRAGSVVADVGCLGWVLGDAVKAIGGTLIGIDQVEPPGRPNHATFAPGSDSTFKVESDSCDLVVAGHVIEHVPNGTAFTVEMLRITKPGGLIWIEAPSELGALVRASDDPEDHHFRSFWDDPQHVRPWPPAALYRLALSVQARPLAIQRAQAGDVPVCRMLARKSDSVSGAPQTRYVTLKGVDYGLKAAYESVWGKQ